MSFVADMEGSFTALASSLSAADLLDPFPNIRALSTKVNALPAIAAWYANEAAAQKF